MPSSEEHTLLCQTTVHTVLVMHGAPHNFRDEFHRHVFLALGLRVYWGGSALASLLGLGLCVSFFL